MREKIILDKKTTADLVYEQLKNDIVDLVYLPGERLSEARIAERYGVSRDPVRKAVARLEQESLITSRKQYGTIINEISIKQGIEICEIRLLLEAYAAEIAATTIADSVAMDLDRKLVALERDVASGEKAQVYLQIFSFDKELHAAIYDACGNETLKSIIDMHGTIIQRIRKANVTWASRELATMREMRAIVDALRKHSPHDAKEAMATHIRNIKTTVETIAHKGMDGSLS